MRYYVYSHSLIDGDIFYIGKGTKNRAYHHNDRSYEWKQYIKQSDGIIIKIEKRFETEDEAFTYEKQRIKECKDLGIYLVNATLGGKGPLGCKQSDETKKKKSIKMTGYKYKIVKCPHCKKTGGETAMKKWHFDKCTGLKQYKARVSINGKRIFLGNYESKDKATQVCIAYYNKNKKPLPKEFIKHRLN